MPRKPAAEGTYYSRNRDAVLAKQKSYYAEHRDAIKSKASAYYIAKRAAIKVRQAAYYAANLEAILARTKAYERANPDKRRDYQIKDQMKHAERRRVARALRYQLNRERRLAANAQWRADNVEYRRLYHAAYSAAHPERMASKSAARRAREQGAIGSHTDSEWALIVKSQRGRCVMCDHRRKLTRDHIVPLDRGGCDYAFNIQGLCRSCNSAKGAKLTTQIVSLFDKVA